MTSSSDTFSMDDLLKLAAEMRPNVEVLARTICPRGDVFVMDTEYRMKDEPEYWSKYLQHEKELRGETRYVIFGHPSDLEKLGLNDGDKFKLTEDEIDKLLKRGAYGSR